MGQVERFHEATRTEIMEKMPPPVSNWMNLMQLMGFEVTFYASDVTDQITHGMVTNQSKYFTFQLEIDKDGSLNIAPDNWQWLPRYASPEDV